MAKLKVKKGDNVVVISGKDRGKTGKITQIIPANNKAVVEGINIIIKHQKPKGNNQKGGIIRKSAPMQISNLMVVCPVCGKATRVGRKEVSDKLSRFCKKCGAVLDKEYVKAKKEQKKKDVSKENTVEKVKSKKEETLNETAKQETIKTKKEEVLQETQGTDLTEKAENSENKTTEKTTEVKTENKTETKTEKAKTEKNLQKEKAIKPVPKPKTRDAVNEQVKKATNKNVARTTTIRKSTNRGK